MEVEHLQVVVRIGAVLFYSISAIIIFSNKWNKKSGHWFWFGAALSVEAVGLGLRLLPSDLNANLPLARAVLHFTAGVLVLYGVTEVVRNDQPPATEQPDGECERCVQETSHN